MTNKEILEIWKHNCEANGLDFNEELTKAYEKWWKRLMKQLGGGCG